MMKLVEQIFELKRWKKRKKNLTFNSNLIIISWNPIGRLTIFIKIKPLIQDHLFPKERFQTLYKIKKKNKKQYHYLRKNQKHKLVK